MSENKFGKNLEATESRVVFLWRLCMGASLAYLLIFFSGYSDPEVPRIKASLNDLHDQMVVRLPWLLPSERPSRDKLSALLAKSLLVFAGGSVGCIVVYCTQFPHFLSASARYSVAVINGLLGGFGLWELFQAWMDLDSRKDGGVVVIGAIAPQTAQVIGSPSRESKAPQS